MPEDEDPQYWLSREHADLANRVAILHAQRRELAARLLPERVAGARYAIAAQFLSGSGIEVGPGTRPFPLPANAKVVLGDIRTADELSKYFGKEINDQEFVDAQTFVGVASESQDFVIAAHVIEHLKDPIGSIEASMRVLKKNGYSVICVPDKRHTFDRLRPDTTLDHLLSDWKDGGAGTKTQAYFEHLAYVVPALGHAPISDSELWPRAHEAAALGGDIHFHAWTFETFQQMLTATSDAIKFKIVAAIGEIVNENIFVIQKR